MITISQARLGPAALLVSAIFLGGCQEDLGSSPAALADAPIVAEERLDSVVNSVRKTIGNPATTHQSHDDTMTVVEESPVTVVSDSATPDTPTGEKSSTTQPEQDLAGRETEPAPERDLAPPVLEWSAPLTREDGSSLADGEIKGYQLYFRLRHQDDFQTLFVEGEKGTRLPLERFVPGAYEFSITTIDTDGLESRRSEPVTVNVI